jgi:hypothetical protein
MPENYDPLRDRLLGQVPVPDDVKTYRDAVTRMVQQNDKRIQRERVFITAFWIFCVASSIAWLWFSPQSAGLPRAPFQACIILIWGGVEVVKHYINACRVDLMKEIKQLQVQVFELQR